MNEVIRTIKSRRSIRNYRNEQITGEELETILDAGVYAPSGMGQQATIMVAIQDPERIAMIAGLNARVMGMDIDPFYGAPTLVRRQRAPDLYRRWKPGHRHNDAGGLVHRRGFLLDPSCERSVRVRRRKEVKGRMGGPGRLRWDRKPYPGIS